MAVKSGRISSKGQITIPKELREKFDLKEGGEALMIPKKNGILIKQKSGSLRGILSGKIDIKGFEKDLKELRKEWKL